MIVSDSEFRYLRYAAHSLYDWRCSKVMIIYLDLYLVRYRNASCHNEKCLKKLMFSLRYFRNFIRMWTFLSIFISTLYLLAVTFDHLLNFYENLFGKPIGEKKIIKSYFERSLKFVWTLKLFDIIADSREICFEKYFINSYYTNYTKDDYSQTFSSS